VLIPANLIRNHPFHPVFQIGSDRCKEAVSLAAPADWMVPALDPEFQSRCVASRRSRISMRDTHTWALFFEKRALAVEDGSWVLESPEALVCDSRTPSSVRFAEAFEDNRLRGLLEDSIGVRALREVLRAELRRESHDILDAAEKVVARLEVTRPALPIDGVFITLQPLMGYEAEAGRAREILAASGCIAAPESLVDALYREHGVQPVAYSAKPRLTASAESSSVEAVSEILRGLLDVARWNESGIVGDVDTEFLHDYRVALRKIRSVLSLTKGVFTAEATIRWKKQLGDVCRKTNALRDLDVQLLSRERLCAMLPEELRHGLDAFFAESEKARAVHVRKVAAFLRSKPYLSLIAGLAAEWEDATHHGEAGKTPIGEMATERLRKRFRRIRKLQRAIGPSTPDGAIHAIRIECKKMRYLLDCFGRLYPDESAAPLGKSLARVQNRLGRYNDTSVQQEHFLERAHRCLDTGDCRMALALGGLIGSLHHEHAALRDKVVEALESFCDRGHRSLVDQLEPLHP
jgi:CHAD domain-containing protein